MAFYLMCTAMTRRIYVPLKHTLISTYHLAEKMETTNKFDGLAPNQAFKNIGCI